MQDNHQKSRTGEDQSARKAAQNAGGSMDTAGANKNTGSAVSTPRCPKCGSGKLVFRHIDGSMNRTCAFTAVQCPKCLPEGTFYLDSPEDMRQFFQPAPSPPPRDPSRCSICGASRIPIEHPKTKFGPCSLIPGSDGKGGCPDPTHDYYEDISRPVASPQGESK